MRKKEKAVKNNRLFYTESEYGLEGDYLEEYFHTHLNQHMLLYQVDRVKSTIHPLYKEALPEQFEFLAKLEIPCSVEITKEDGAYKEDNFGYEEIAFAKIYILEKTIKENSIQIKIGDYAKYEDRFYEFTKVHNIADSSMFSKNYKNIVRSFSARLAKKDQVPEQLYRLDNEIN